MKVPSVNSLRKMDMKPVCLENGTSETTFRIVLKTVGLQKCTGMAVGVGQTPDVWDNAYFDGGYFHNGKIVDAKGFCTDVFFEEGNRFIRESVKKKKPFFAYISTNAPHGPFHCLQKYLDMYQDQSGRIASFFGMITNIDDNIGKPENYSRTWVFMITQSLSLPLIMERPVVDKFSMLECGARKEVSMMEDIGYLSLCIGRMAVWIN